jgi:nicotinamidase-related amidase
MTHADSPVAQHIGFAEMVRQTNLFDHINRVLDAARGAGLFVAYVSADFSPSGYRYPRRGEFCRFVADEHDKGEVLRPGAWGYDLHDAVERRDDEPVILARQIGAFAGSELDDVLKARGITDLVLTGVATSFVVTSTAWSAIDRGYSCIVLEDCCTSGSAEMHQDALDHLRPIADIWTSRTFIEAISQ